MSSVAEAQRGVNGERTSAGSETLILQSHPSKIRSYLNLVMAHESRVEHIPSSSGDLLRSPGWSFKLSLIS